MTVVMDLITVVARVRAKPGMESELRATLLASAATAREERGNVVFDLQEKIGDRGLFLSFEQWRSQQDLDRHLTQPYMKAFMARAPYLLDGPPQLMTCASPAVPAPAPLPTEIDMQTAIDQPTLRQFLARTLHTLEQQAGSRTYEVPLDAHGDQQREEVLIRYTVGEGRFATWQDPARSGETRLLSGLDCRMYRLDRTLDGTFRGRWYPQIQPAEMALEPAPTHDRPFENPVGPFVETGVGAWTEAEWTFADGSSIIGTGPASLQLVHFKTGDSLFLVSVAGIIAGGTGKYVNARGVKTALGATYIPKGVNMFALPPEARFPAVTVETFRVVRAMHIAPGNTPPRKANASAT